MQWEIVIGFETHVQLTTHSKIFSGASIAFGAEPNTQACAVDLALPGVLPVLNQAAVEKAIRFGLAVNATIAPRSIFARKNYFYPDLPKGYQISQMDLPIVQGGGVSIMLNGQPKIVQLTRAHLEEDAGKSLHEDFSGMSGIDLNRAGTPLLEIVTEPVMRSSAEAVAYAKALHSLVMWIGICDGNMQEGSFRCDANVSVRPLGHTEFGTRVEIKNLNSFRFLEKAIDYEVRRQIELIEDGGRVVQETRLYDPDKDQTRSMRSKEDAEDYRYFPDPDLLPVIVSPDWIAQVRDTMPELPSAMAQRFITDYQLSDYDAAHLTSSLALAQFFEQTLALTGSVENSSQSKLIANWLMGEIANQLNRDNLTISDSPVTPAQLAQLVTRIADNTINGKIAKEIFMTLWAANNPTQTVDAIIDAQGLRQISDTGAIEAVIDAIMAANPNQLADYRSGKDKLFGFFVGQAMKALQGKANPQQLNDLLKAKLG